MTAPKIAMTAALQETIANYQADGGDAAKDMIKFLDDMIGCFITESYPAQNDSERLEVISNLYALKKDVESYIPED